MQKKSLIGRIKANAMFYLFLLPAFLFFLIFVVYPFLSGFIMSFQDYGLLGPTGWCGLQNYIDVLTDPAFHQALINTCIFAFFAVLSQVFVPLFIAIILHETIFVKARTFLNTVIYIPKLLSTVVIVSVFANLLGAGGLISEMAYNLGLTPVPENLMASEGLSRTLFVIINLWRNIGYYVIMYSAALLAIDATLYEAGEIDGATWTQKTRYITIPGTSAMMKTVCLLSIMGIFKTFSLSFILQTPATADHLTTLMVYTYNVGMLQFNIGMSVASATIVFVLTAVVSLVAKRLLRY